MKHDIHSLIIYEDPHIIVCRKPAGVPTQSARISTPDMESMLKNYLSGGYLAVIHRLDQPVEGLLVFAKTPGAARELNRQLTSSGFGKYYRAVVSGIPEPPEGTLEDYLVKDARTNTSRICTKNTPGFITRLKKYIGILPRSHLLWISILTPAGITRYGCRWRTWDVPLQAIGNTVLFILIPVTQPRTKT